MIREIVPERAALGGWCIVGSPYTAELMASAGFDYVCVDCQHGLIGYESMLLMLQAMSRTAATPVVRVPSNDWSDIGKALDAGASGVIVPMVNSRGEAEAAVAACRYPPNGTRSFGPSRADPRLHVLCMVMIETAAGLEAADEICSTPGLDGVYVGPSDLAVSLGLQPTLQPREPVHLEAIARVLGACRAHGIIPGIHAGTGEMGRTHAEAGFRMITVATDSGIVARGAAAELAAANPKGQKG